MVLDVKAIASDLDATNLTIHVQTKQDEVIASYFNAFKGRDYFHVRTLWQDHNGAWRPGKGVSMPAKNAEEFCNSIGSGFTTAASRPSVAA